MCIITRMAGKQMSAERASLMLFCACRPAAEGASDIHCLWLAMPRTQGAARYELAHSACQEAQQAWNVRQAVKPLWTTGICVCRNNTSRELLLAKLRHAELQNAQQAD